jgi:hypothetical protein
MFKMKFMFIKKMLMFFINMFGVFSKKKIKKTIGFFLYNLNLKIFNHVNKAKEIPIFNNEDSYEVIKISFTDEELEIINLDLKKKNYIEKKFSWRFMLFPKNENFLNDVEMSWGFSRKYYVNLFNKKLGSKIKSFFGNGNYRFEHFWIWKTPKQSSNVNSNFHVDNDMPGAMKIMIYLNKVDEFGGPFAVKGKNDKIFKILGDVGTAIIFNQNKCLHAGLPNINNDRFVLVTTIYPSLRKNITYEELKPINSFCEYNPFTKLS